MTTFLNRGMYDVVEAARLVRVTPGTVVRWASDVRSRPPLVRPSLDGLYSFHDLISLHLVALLSKRGVRLPKIAEGIRYLSRKLGTDWPLAHRDLATVGRDFFLRDSGSDDWLDIGRGGQQAFQSMIKPAVRRIEYGTDRLAAIWRPADRVWLNPRVQAGASCIDPTRIPTATIRQIVASGDHPVDVAADYELVLDDVLAALAFEDYLDLAA